MSKKWPFVLLAIIAATVASTDCASVRGADAVAKPPVKATKSANDPTRPVPGGVRWFMRNHQSYLQQTKTRKIALCFLGDSITAMWPGDQFKKHFGKYDVVNFGVGGDRTENVLWRLENGELKGTSPKVIVLMIGTNNLGFNTAEEVALGVATVVKKLRTDFPKTKILLLGILPKAGNYREKIEGANAITAKLDDGSMIRYLDFGPKFFNDEGKVQGGILSDGVHLTPKGYQIWAEAIGPLLTEMMAQPTEDKGPTPTKSPTETKQPSETKAAAESKAAAAAKGESRIVPWPIPAMQETPKVHPTDLCPEPGMRAFFYEGLPYKGKPTYVYAYYAAPQGTPPAGGWPAVVCAHGGGGTAYPDWIKAWNKRGYAAISMDLEGHLPNGKAHENSGPARIDWFGDRALPDNEKWFFQAVAHVIRANSLLRSFPEINPKKIGLTGISWGGTIVSTVAGVDGRFAFVVPVYGCGFIHESDNAGLNCWFKPDKMTAEQFRDYRTKFDPSAHLPYAKMPIFWMTGFDDPVFQVDIFTRSARIVGGPSTLCIRGHMVHGHIFGWQKQELFAFADSVVKGAPPIPSIGRPTLDPATRLVRAKVTGSLLGASVHYTASDGPYKGRYWQDIPCDIGDGEVVSRKPLPDGARAYNVNGKDDRGNLSSSDLIEVKAP